MALVLVLVLVLALLLLLLLLLLQHIMANHFRSLAIAVSLGSSLRVPIITRQARALLQRTPRSRANAEHNLCGCSDALGRPLWHRRVR